MQVQSYIATVIDETGKVATLCGVYDGVVVNAEHVAAADALLLVTFLPHVCDHLQTDDCYVMSCMALKFKKKTTLDSLNHKTVPIKDKQRFPSYF